MFCILFFVFFPCAFNASLSINPAARGAVGLATIPIQTLLVAAAFCSEKSYRPPKIAGVLLFVRRDRCGFRLRRLRA